MVPIDFTNDQTLMIKILCVELFEATLIQQWSRYASKITLETLYLHYYTRYTVFL